MSKLDVEGDGGQPASAPPHRRVGRPNVRDERRNEILDAAVEVILDHGIAGATRVRIAERAGVQPPAIHHFVGAQDEVLRAAIERIGSRLTAEVVPDREPGSDPADRAIAAVDAVFGAAVDRPTVNRFVDELIAHSYRDEPTRAALVDFYRSATDQFAAILGDGCDDADPIEVRAAASEIAALAHAGGTFRHLGLAEQARAAHERALHLAASAGSPPG